MRPVGVLWSGDGSTAVLVHGDVLGACIAWAAQGEVVDRFALRLVNRRGCGGSPPAHGQDFLVDADDGSEALEGGAHLVGHSSGGVVELLAAAKRPERVHSLTVVEPPVSSLAPERQDTRRFTGSYEYLVARCYSPEFFLQEHLTLIGAPRHSIASKLPAMLPVALCRSVMAQMRGKHPWGARIPFDVLTRPEFPRLVVSGGRHDAFEAACSALAEEIGADRAVLPGSGHAVQALGTPFSDVLARIWEKGAPLSGH